MKYLAKKLAGFVMTMLVVSFLVFAAFAVIPGDPATAMLGTQATPEKLAALREQMGLNEPLLVRFGSWAANFIQGDFGTSYKYQMSVGSMIAEKIPVTLTLTAMSFLIMVAVSIPVGLFCAHHAGGKVDRIVLIVDQVIMAIPPFFSGILITLLFGLVLHLFTPGGYVSYTTSVTGFLGYLIFPSVAIALPKAAMAIKLLRTSVLSEMKLDYVRTAYSRGNNTKGVLYQCDHPGYYIPGHGACGYGRGKYCYRTGVQYPRTGQDFADFNFQPGLSCSTGDHCIYRIYRYFYKFPGGSSVSEDGPQNYIGLIRRL